MLILQSPQNQGTQGAGLILVILTICLQCDGVAPACGGCTKFGRAATCSLSGSGARQAKDYPTYLHGRIQKLQLVLERAAKDPTSVDDGHLEYGNFQADDHSGAAQHCHTTPASVDTLVADIGAVPIQASSYSMAGDGPSLSKILLGAASKASLSLPEKGKARQEKASCTYILPTKDVALKLARLYIDQVYPRLPFFSIQGFWVQFNSVFPPDHMTSSLDPVASTHESTEPQPGMRTPNIDQGYSTFTVLLVLAIATSSLSRSADSAMSSQAQRLFSAALQYRESAIRPNTVVGVQSLLFLIQYATLNPSVLDAWYLIGVGMRTCIDLGLHQDPQPLNSASPSLLETRRRLWWSMYSFDRSISLGCGRPTEISDDTIGARLPTFRIESVATEDQIEGYLQRYRALQIQSEIYDVLDRAPEKSPSSTYETIRQLSNKLESWASNNAPTHSQTLVGSEWLMGKILLYRPCRLVPQRTRIEIHQLWQAALRFATLYRQLVEANSIFYVQIASEKTYWVGLAILYSFWKLGRSHTGESYPERASQLDLWKAVQNILYIIRTLSDRWEDGGLLAQRFEVLSTSTIGMEETESGQAGGTEDMPAEVCQFANYVSLTSLWTATESCRASPQDTELGQLISAMVAQQSTT